METIIKTKDREHSFLIPCFYNPEDWEGTIPFKEQYTFSDYDKLPEGSLYQLIGGQLIMTPAPGINHQKISRDLGIILHNYVTDNDLGEVFFSPIDVKLNNTNIYQPDIIFISRKNKKIIGKKRILGPPDMIIEILSPATAYYDLREKYELYEKSGVKEYWIVDPNQKKIEVFENKNKKYFLYCSIKRTGKVSSKVLKNFCVAVKEIFS